MYAAVQQDAAPPETDPVGPLSDCDDGTARRLPGVGRITLGQSGSERTAERTRIVLDRLRALRDVPEVAELLAS